LRDLLRYNLKTVRAYLLKEAFQQLWDYNSPAWAGKFLDDWCRQVMRSRIEPLKKIARPLREHRDSKRRSASWSYPGAGKWQREQTAVEPLRGRTATMMLFLSAPKWACW
jgi:hypothetical protein